MRERASKNARERGDRVGKALPLPFPRLQALGTHRGSRGDPRHDDGHLLIRTALQERETGREREREGERRRERERDRKRERRGGETEKE